MAYSRYEYLANPVILNYISRLQQRTQWTRIVVLNREDLPIKAIEGRATGGSITINSSSAVRRTGSLTLVTDYDAAKRAAMTEEQVRKEILNEVTNINSLISMNKRVQIEVGLKNTGGEFVDFDIFWMPLGTFVISNASVSYNNSGITISLKLNDKMALLNGEEGGTFFGPLTHSPLDGEEGAVKFRDLIMALVHDMGEIPEWQIIIDDIPDKIEKPVMWQPENLIEAPQDTFYSTNTKTFREMNDNSAWYASLEEEVLLNRLADAAESGQNQYINFIFDFTTIESYKIITVNTADFSVEFNLPALSSYEKYEQKNVNIYFSKEPILQLRLWKTPNGFVMRHDAPGADAIGYSAGDMIGYQYTDCVYPADQELTSQAGESIQTVLEKVKNTLGNYEYFFDLDGVFHFQEIKNYLNEGSASNNWETALGEKYFLKTRKDKVVYSFEDATLINSYANNPQYTAIKNDYNIWGESSDSQTAIHYHLVIDKLDKTAKKWQIEFENGYEGELSKIKPNGVTKGIGGEISDWRINAFLEAYLKNSIQRSPFEKEIVEELPKCLKLSPVIAEDENLGAITIAQFLDNGSLISINDDFDISKLIPEQSYIVIQDSFFPITSVVSSGGDEYTITTTADPLDQYFQVGDQVTVIDLGAIVSYEVLRKDGNIPYYLDGIDVNDISLPSGADIKNFAIQDIGRRTKVVPDKGINCIFKDDFGPTIPNYIFSSEQLPYNSNKTIINPTQIADATVLDTDGQVKTITFASCLAPASSYQNPAYDALRMSIHENLSYNNNINLTTMPVYHLDVNQRITVENDESDIHGDYIIKTITIPLDLGGMMTINAQQAIERV